MRKSGLRSIAHIYSILFLSLFGTLLAALLLFFLLITVKRPEQAVVRSDWPKAVTEGFQEQIIFIDGMPQLKQQAVDFLRDEHIGFQLLDGSGCQVLQYQKPLAAGEAYTISELLALEQRGHLENGPLSSFLGAFSHAGEEYIYILHFPVNISAVTMYLNGERFAGGKAAILPVIAVLLLIVLASGALYGFWITRAMKRLNKSLRDIAARRYLPIENRGVFADLYDGLNTLDEEIRTGDRLRSQTEKLQKEWLANITHDLKTPLAPIRGYAEIMQENGGEYSKYAAVMLKNTAYMEKLIDDMKLAYQLEANMVPVERRDGDMVRFLKELVIGILNTPEYENRTIQFQSPEHSIPYAFDETLLTRAFRNLIINALVHGGEDARLSLHLFQNAGVLTIEVSDNGKGMDAGDVDRLFTRYCRGTGTGQRTEGTGLGLAIVKSIVELHGGSVAAASIPGSGTTFTIQFPLN